MTKTSMRRLGRQSLVVAFFVFACSKAFAYLEGRDYAIPEDVKAIFPSLARHRMSVPHGMETSVNEQISDLLNQVAIP